MQNSFNYFHLYDTTGRFSKIPCKILKFPRQFIRILKKYENVKCQYSYYLGMNLEFFTWKEEACSYFSEIWLMGVLGNLPPIFCLKKSDPLIILRKYTQNDAFEKRKLIFTVQSEQNILVTI